MLFREIVAVFVGITKSLLNTCVQNAGYLTVKLGETYRYRRAGNGHISGRYCYRMALRYRKLVQERKDGFKFSATSTVGLF
jgi:hypothetical protein